MISSSQNSSMPLCFSTTVTLVPSAASIDAYSIPITPAPTTTSDAGIRFIPRSPSESITVTSSNSTPAGRVGFDEPRRPEHKIDVVAQQLIPDNVHLAGDHLIGPLIEVRDRDVGLHPV